jgi:hypothetical protein
MAQSSRPRAREVGGGGPKIAARLTRHRPSQNCESFHDIIPVGGAAHRRVPGPCLCNLHNHTSLETEFVQEGLIGSSPSRLPQAKICPFRELLVDLEASTCFALW